MFRILEERFLNLNNKTYISYLFYGFTFLALNTKLFSNSASSFLRLLSLLLFIHSDKSCVLGALADEESTVLFGCVLDKDGGIVVVVVVVTVD